MVQTADPRFAAGEDHEHRGDNGDSRHKEDTAPKKTTIPRRSHNKNPILTNGSDTQNGRRYYR